jgi:predicted dienelactone hydrolase
MLLSRFALVLCPLLLGLLAASCSNASDDPPAASSAGHATLAYPVEQVGPFHVGYRTLKATYQPPAGAPSRTIPLNLWYPTTDTSGDSPRYSPVMSPDADVFTDATLAPPADPTGYPVVVHSHGHWGFGGNSSDVMHYFASHGWVVIAPDHLGDTLPEFSNDRSDPALYFLRSLDIKAALDTLEALPASDPLAGHCVTDRVFMTGHSRGCVTTWASSGATFDVDAVRAMCNDGTSFSRACTEDEIQVFAGGLGDRRVIAGLPMAGGIGDEPGWFGLTGYNAVHKPMLSMSGSDDDTAGAGRLWDRVSGLDFTWVDLAGGCHQIFGLGGCAKITDAEGFPLVNTYALAFARRTLLGDTSPRVAAILGGESLSPLVTFKHKSP